MDPDSLAQCLTDRTRAVIVAHMYGLPADMDGIRTVLRDRPDITLIEDASLAVGADYRGRRVGSLGDAAAFSLASGKVLGVIGSGGAITTDSQDYYLALNHARHYGRNSSPYHYCDPLPEIAQPRGMVIRGLNERMDTIQAAVGLVKLEALEADLAKRRSIAALYDTVLESAPCQCPVVPEGYTHSYRVYVLRVDPTIRDVFVERMCAEEIQVGTLYVPPDHLQPYFMDNGPGRVGLLPVTESVANELVCLPSHPYMTIDDAWRVADTTRRILAELNG